MRGTVSKRLRRLARGHGFVYQAFKQAYKRLRKAGVKHPTLAQLFKGEP